MPYLYENRDSKYRKFSEREWRWKNTFSYDDHKGFSDLKIIGMQNADRFLQYGRQIWTSPRWYNWLLHSF